MRNHNLDMENLIKDFKGDKTLLLHSCCGPCSTAVIDRLKNHFDITVFYYNPCLYPQEEYEKRKNEQIKFINRINEEEQRNIKILVPEFNPDNYYNAIKQINNFENLPEGGARCYVCYFERLNETQKYAKQGGFDYFGTTLSVSPHKNADWLNEIGLKLASESNVDFLVADFKKKDGYVTSLSLSKKYELYRQNYCGCVYSLNETKKRLNVEK